jgi:hypothetical protein
MGVATAAKVAMPAAPATDAHQRRSQPARQGATQDNGFDERTTPGGLPRSVAQIMESHFGTSFADVRIHCDDAAAREVLSRGAVAYAKGEDVYFGRGRFQPSTERGQHLIAHELAHVVQQRNGRSGRSGQERATATTRRLEDEAERAANSLRASGRASASRVVERAAFGTEQMSVSEDIAALRDALGGGLQSAARWVISRATDDPLIQDLGRFMTRVSGMRSVRLPRDMISGMEDLYEWARSVAPFWFAVPALSFHGDGALGFTGVEEVGVLTIVLLICVVLLLMWILQGLDPSIRRARERATQELIDRITNFFDNPPVIDPFPPTDIPTPDDLPIPDAEPIPDTEPVPVPVPVPVPDTDAPPVEDVGPSPEPEPNPEPDEDPPPPVPPPCLFPTGRTMADPIPIAWHKVRSLYDSPITLGGGEYHCDDPEVLPRGEPIGVPSRFWPRVGKIVQLSRERRGSAAHDFREVLRSYGYNWGGSRHLQAEHVQDLQWAAPDAMNLDSFENLWPYDGAANMSAGATQNIHQRVSYCEGPLGPAHIGVPIQTLKRPGGFGRYFVITSVGMP